jgi:hypothetical protein
VEHVVRCTGVTRSFVIPMSETLGVAEGLEDIAVGVFGP